MRVGIISEDEDRLSKVREDSKVEGKGISGGQQYIRGDDMIPREM
jgi:hypothetical protein